MYKKVNIIGSILEGKLSTFDQDLTFS